MKKVIASGVIIIKENKLLVILDNKDNFYKIPGGSLEEGESLEECAIRELKEETGFSGEIIAKLPSMRLKKRPGTKEVMDIELYHYIAKLKEDISEYKSFNYKGHIVQWISIEDIKENRSPVAPNIKFLIEKIEIN
jgi:ADP-ribose pyrophosphatase YjhB (NUDIX family)